MRFLPLTKADMTWYYNLNKYFFAFFRENTNNPPRSDRYYYGWTMSDKLEKHVEMLKRGDMRAFDYIYERTNRSVYFAALYILHDKMHAEDVMQETYVKALSAIAQYRAGTNFTAWLRSIGRSLALTHIRRYSKEVATDFEKDAYKYGVKETELPFIFDIAADVLAEDEYEIIMLCHVAGYKRREVAEMLGMPIGTVTWKNNEALKKLRAKLEKEGLR